MDFLPAAPRRGRAPILGACALVLILPLAACSAGGPGGLKGLLAPNPLKGRVQNAPGTDTREKGVDGLLVGHRLMAAGEYELALKAYLRAAGEDGINADVLSAIGSANLKLGRLHQAEEILQRAIKMDPRFVPALNNLGVVYMEQGKYGAARALFQQAFQLDSGQTDAIRENLRRAIARSEAALYAAPEDETGQDLDLLRRGDGELPLLTQL